MKAKMYPFSTIKHAHDIEFYRNRLFNTMRDMESGEIPMDSDRYDKIYDMYYGKLEKLYDAVLYNTKDGRISWLTGEQISLAKKIIFWAHEQRAESLIKAGKTEYLKYC